MLSEEEKKAIEYLKYMKNRLDFNKIGYVYAKEDIEKVLNLVTRQSNILNKIEEYAKGMEDKELLLILKSNEIDELINKCKKEGLINE